MPRMNRRSPNALPIGGGQPRRSERIRARTEAAARAAARAAAQVARQPAGILIIEEALRSVTGQRRSGRAGTRSAGRSTAAQPGRPETNLALQNFLRTSGVLDSSTPPLAPVAGSSTSLTQPLNLSALSAGGGSGALTSRPDANIKALERIKRDLLNFEKERPEGCHVELDGGNLFRWNATIEGPTGTPYEGGVFRLAFVFHQDYPFLPPKVSFVSKVYHCNVASTGNICMDILSSEWSPALTVTKILLSIISLLGDPNPEDPLQPILADLCKRRRDIYDANARLWTQKYAKPEMALLL